MLTKLQKLAAQAIVNVFETGRARGHYGRVTLIPGDAGHLTYGRSQTTLASGGLHLLVKAYCAAPGATLAGPLSGYLDRLGVGDLTLDTDAELRRLLEAAGDDPVMHEVQDSFFDRAYWGPAVAAAEALDVTSGLGTAVVYDSHVHGSWRRLRDRTNAQHGDARRAGGNEWIRRYVDERRGWLATHANTVLHRTVYRMDAFKVLMEEGRWDLAVPFRVCGVTIDDAALLAPALISASALDESERVLLLRQPPLRGADVEAVQRALQAAGIPLAVDGVYGQDTAEAVRRFQAKHSLVADGVVGPVTRAARGL